MGRCRQAMRICCRHPEEKWWLLCLGGGSGGGELRTDSKGVLEEEMPTPVAGLAMGLRGSLPRGL